MTLVEFLVARLDEDEAKARAATPGPWRVDPAMFEADSFDIYTLPSETEPIGQGVAADHEGFGACSISDAEYLVHYSSDRVLREVEAKRKILAEHMPHDRYADECRTCGCPDSCGCAVGVDFPCDTLRFLALPYDLHPDYDEGWRP